jgi:hypothetical protein
MAEDFLELIAPAGCDEANHDRVRYRVDNDGRIRVPREAAQHFIRAGFRVAPDRPAPNRSHPCEPAPTKDGDGAPNRAKSPAPLKE